MPILPKIYINHIGNNSKAIPITDFKMIHKISAISSEETVSKFLLKLFKR